MDLGPQTDAALLERALNGQAVDDARVQALTAVAVAVGAVDQSGLRARDEFVASVRERLLDESSAIAIGRTGSSDTAPPATSSDGATVLRLPHRRVRLVAAAAASVLILAALLGVASRSAVPGDALYPVKQLLDRAAVGLSGSRLDEGRTHLAQAQQHISEARELLDRGAPAPADLDVALDAATDSVGAGRSILTAVYTEDHRPEALTELADFLARARPQVAAMDTRVPEASRPAYLRLRQLLADAQLAALRELARCPACGDAAARARVLLEALDTAASGAAPSTAPSPSPTPTSAPSITVVAPSIGVTTDGLGVGGGGIAGPGATVQLPSAGVTTSGVVVGGGGVTLPGATVPLPTLSVPLPAPTSTSLPLLPGASLP